MTCCAAEGGALNSSFGSELAASVAKTQAGYALVRRILDMDSEVNSRTIAGALIGVVLLIPAGFPLWMTVLLNSDPNRSDVSLLSTGMVAFLLLLCSGAVLGGLIGRLSTKHKRLIRLPTNKFHSSLVPFILIVTLVGLEIGFLVSPISLIGPGSTATSIDMWISSFCIGSIAFILALLFAMLALAGRLIINSLASSSKMGDPDS